MTTLQKLANDSSPKTEDEIQELARYAVRMTAGLGAIDGIEVDEATKQRMYEKALLLIREIYNDDV